jgi:hypothetical protein
MAQSFGGQERSDPGNGFGGQERSGFGMDFDRHVFRILLGVVIVTLAIGTTVYHYVEHLA